MLKEKFRVRCDDKPAGGKWERVPAGADGNEKECFTWNWGPRPFVEVPPGVYSGFKQMAQFGRSPDLKGNRTFSVESSEFPESGVVYKVYLDHAKPGIEDCWKNLPGPFLPWFLVCQSQGGMKWDELLFARDVIAPGHRLSAYLLRKYENGGFFMKKGVRWKIAESRATLVSINDEQCQLDYCGDPSVLWRLYRRLYRPGIKLPDVEVINKRGELPYLRMTWDAHLGDEISYRLQHMNVRIDSSLWNH